MCDIAEIKKLITKLYVKVNASNLGWIVEFESNKIMLSKKTNLLTMIDNDTPKLLELLFRDLNK